MIKNTTTKIAPYPLTDKLRKKILIPEYKHWTQRPEVREQIRQTLLGRKVTPETMKNRVQNRMFGEKHPLWKGAEANYFAIHSWVARELGKSDECEHCGKIGYGHMMHWANRDHEYKRVKSDWIRLCAKCHMKYDLQNGLRKLGAICQPRH